MVLRLPGRRKVKQMLFTLHPARKFWEGDFTHIFLCCGFSVLWSRIVMTFNHVDSSVFNPTWVSVGYRCCTCRTMGRRLLYSSKTKHREPFPLACKVYRSAQKHPHLTPSRGRAVVPSARGTRRRPQWRRAGRCASCRRRLTWLAQRHATPAHNMTPRRPPINIRKLTCTTRTHTHAHTECVHAYSRVDIHTCTGARTHAHKHTHTYTERETHT